MLIQMMAIPSANVGARNGKAVGRGHASVPPVKQAMRRVMTAVRLAVRRVMRQGAPPQRWGYYRGACRRQRVRIR